MSEASQPAEAYDIAVIGGAFSGAATALLLRRWLPDSRIVIIERRPQFDRKVGEATVEISGFFLHHVLGLYDHLSREHLPKHGLRYWFTDHDQRRLGEMSEVGPRELPQLPAFQLDRAKLDEHILACAAAAGCEILRPARVDNVTLDWPESTLQLQAGAQQRTLRARWLIDASGREGCLATRLKLRRPVDDHPTIALWARWRGVADMDGDAVLGGDPRATRLPAVAPSRRLATNHFCGYGWWCWVIPLGGGETSIGLVYDRRLYDPGLASLRPRAAYRRFVDSQAGLRELVAGAEMDEQDFSLRRNLPYRTERYMGRGWALVGDAASFIDPFYSPGLDHAAISIYATARLLEADLGGSLDAAALDAEIARHNENFTRSYEHWLAGLYLDKYELMGDAELMRCSMLVDTSLYYLGVVAPIMRNLESLRNPVLGLALPQARFAAAFMRFFRARLVKLARFRRRTGRYGRRNIGWHSYGPAFGLGWRSHALLLKGLRAWLGLEAGYLGHRLRRGAVDLSPPTREAAAN